MLANLQIRGCLYGRLGGKFAGTGCFSFKGLYMRMFLPWTISPGNTAGTLRAQKYEVA